MGTSWRGCGVSKKQGSHSGSADLSLPRPSPPLRAVRCTPPPTFNTQFLSKLAPNCLYHAGPSSILTAPRRLSQNILCSQFPTTGQSSWSPALRTSSGCREHCCEHLQSLFFFLTGPASIHMSISSHKRSTASVVAEVRNSGEGRSAQGKPASFTISL